MPKAETLVSNEPDLEGSGGIKAGGKLREVDKKAQSLRDKTILPKFPGSRIDDIQFEEWARLLTPEMWNRLALYTYRTFPVIIRQMSNPKNDNNIDVISNVVELRKYLCELHGGGKYLIHVTDAGEKIGEIRTNIPIHEFEPKLDVRELDIYAKENQAYIQSLKYRGVLDQDGKPLGRGQAPGQQPQQPNPTMADLMNMMDRFSQMQEKMSSREKEELRHRLEESKEAGLGGQIGAILLEKMKQDSPSTMVAGLTGVLSAAKEMMGPKEVRDDSKTYEMFKTMLEMQTKHSEQMISLIKEMKTPAQGGEKLLDSIETAMTVMERLSEIGGGKNRSGWELGLDAVKEIGLPLLQYGTQIYAISKGLGTGTPLGTAPAPGTPGAQITKGITGKGLSSSELALQRAREAAKEKPAMATEADQTAAPTQPGEAPQVAELPQQLVQQMGMAAGPILKHMADDKDGVEFALKLIDMYGKPAYAMIANYGEETIFAAMQAIPPFWEQLSVYGEGKVKEFVHLFCHYEEYLEPPQEEEVKEPEVVPPPTKGGRKGRIK